MARNLSKEVTWLWRLSQKSSKTAFDMGLGRAFPVVPAEQTMPSRSDKASAVSSYTPSVCTISEDRSDKSQLASSSLLHNCSTAMSTSYLMYHTILTQLHDASTLRVDSLIQLSLCGRLAVYLMSLWCQCWPSYRSDASGQYKSFGLSVKLFLAAGTGMAVLGGLQQASNTSVAYADADAKASVPGTEVDLPAPEVDMPVSSLSLLANISCKIVSVLQLLK